MPRLVSVKISGIKSAIVAIATLMDNRGLKTQKSFFSIIEKGQQGVRKLRHYILPKRNIF
jgi:hypothetical protein